MVRENEKEDMKVTNFRQRLALLPLTLFAVLLVAFIVGTNEIPPTANAQSAPVFKVDPTWPQEMPKKWIMGAVTSVFVDAKDHVWVTHLPETLTEEETSAVQKPPIGECCVPAPVVIEFDPGYFGISEERAWAVHRSQRVRLDRDLPASPRPEVHPRRQTPDDDRTVRCEQRQ